MKKIIALFLSLALFLTLPACSTQSEKAETERMQLTPENIANFLAFRVNVDGGKIHAEPFTVPYVGTSYEMEGNATIKLQAAKLQNVSFDSATVTLRIKCNRLNKAWEDEGWRYTSGSFEVDGVVCQDVQLTIAYDGSTIGNDQFSLVYNKTDFIDHSKYLPALDADDFTIEFIAATGSVTANEGATLIVTEPTTAETYATTAAPTT